MSAHAFQFLAIVTGGIVYFAARYRVIRWWRGRTFEGAMRELIDADARAMKARGK